MSDIDALVRTLGCVDFHVRVEARRCLTELGQEPGTLDALAAALADDARPFGQRLGAAVVLGRIGPVAAPAVPALIDALLWDESFWVREACAVSLGRIRDAQAIDALTRAWAEDESKIVHAAAGAALQLLNPRPVVAGGRRR